jgi:hypothetical protein
MSLDASAALVCQPFPGLPNWDETKAVAAEWGKAGSWDGEAVVPEPLPQPALSHRVAIDCAVKAFLAESPRAGSSVHTTGKDRSARRRADQTLAIIEDHFDTESVVSPALAKLEGYPQTKE